MEANLLTTAIDFIVGFADRLMPLMATVFVLGVALRILVTFTISRELWFAKEFDKRVHFFLEGAGGGKGEVSFYVITKRLLEKTYYELFEVRAILKRRKPDAVSALSDRLFLIQHGCACLVKDTLKHVRYLKAENGTPKMLDVSKSVFEHNPCFRRVFGLVPVATSNDFLSILPGLFIVGGIFGTFLGIMKALPELGGMEMSDVEGTKALMDAFLAKVAFSMGTSAVGIFLSVGMTLLNTLLSAERPFINAVQRLETSLDLLWNRSTNNLLPSDLPEFDEHRDAIEALAEDAIKKELDKKVPFIKQAS